MKNTILIILFLSLLISCKESSNAEVANAAEIENEITDQINKVEPPNWWVGFESDSLQILVYEPGIGEYEASVDHPGIKLKKVHKARSANYLFLDLGISETVQAGKFNLEFRKDDSTKVHTYELKEREFAAEDFKGFNTSDVVYLITPDRYVNADPSNDTFEYLREKTIDRSKDYSRHGGDIKGMTQSLDYIKDLGFTAIWPNPLLINDMTNWSYHGYAITDYYKVDPRFGTLEDYKELCDEADKRGIKIIMDQVANHCGRMHWWMEDLPFDDWVNFQKEYEAGEPTIYSNHRRTANQDIYASESDKKGLNDGWFVSDMPDLNQRNPFMANYIIQNSIWWIETLKLGGIRQDTYPYPDKEFMSDWAEAIMNEYPNFNIVGEEWSYNPLLIAYWQDGANNKDGYDSNLPSSMDFAMQRFITEAVTEDESWDKGLVKLYEGLANDFGYVDPSRIMLFNDNHDMDRIHTQTGEDVTATKMATASLLMLPRIPQMYYGTEILMENSDKPGDHGLIRTDFPGGWEGDAINVFTGDGLSAEQKDMQDWLKKVLNFRKESTAIHSGSTKHFAPKDGVYTLFRYTDDEVVLMILNKNDATYELDLSRFEEMNLNGKQLTNVISGDTFVWGDSLSLDEKGVFIFSSK